MSGYPGRLQACCTCRDHETDRELFDHRPEGRSLGTQLCFDTIACRKLLLECGNSSLETLDFRCLPTVFQTNLRTLWSRRRECIHLYTSLVEKVDSRLGTVHK